MYHFEILKSVDSNLWDTTLKQSSYATFFQTFEHLDSESWTPNNFPIFINILDESKNIKGQLGLVVHKKVKAYSSPLMNRLLNIFSKFGSKGQWVGGPIIHENDKDKRIEIVKIIIKALDKVSEENNLSLLSGYTSPQDFLIDKDYNDEFIKNKYKIHFHVQM